MRILIVALVLLSCKGRSAVYEKKACIVTDCEEKKKTSVLDEINPPSWICSTDCGFRFSSNREKRKGDTVWILKRMK